MMACRIRTCAFATAAFALLLTSAGPSLAQDRAWQCAKTELESATVWSGRGLKQMSSSEAERIVLRPDPGLMDFDAGDGDDVVYVVDPPGNQTITAGPGADTVVICRMMDLVLSVKLGDETTGGADLEDDRLVLNPAVFQGIPDGFVRQVFVSGISPQNDRIELRLPRGVDFHYAIGRIRAGKVVFNIAPGNAADRLDAGVFEVVRDVDAPATPIPDLPPALSTYDKTRSCDGAGAESFAKGVEDLRYLSYTQGPDVVTTVRVPGEHIHHTWDGDDLAYVESSQMLFTGRGADEVIVCALDDPETSISLGPGGSFEDFDPDTLVVEAARFQDGVRRKLEVHGLSPVNDRIVLRLPPGLDPKIVTGKYGAAHATIGDLTIAVGPSNSHGGADSHRGMFVIDRVGSAEPAKAGRSELPDLANVTCPDRNAPGPLAEARTNPAHPVPVQIGYSTGPDRILVEDAIGIDYYDAMDGDDRIFVFEPRDGVLIHADRGSDIVAVCAMRSLSLQIELGDMSHTADDAPDAVILEPGVFLGVPAGVRRRIGIFGAVLADDRVVLRLPPGMQPKKLHDTGYGVVEVAVGRVLVSIYRVDDWMNVKMPRDAIQVVTAPAPEGPVATMDLPPPKTAATAETCPRPGDDRFATPSDARHTDIPTRIFGTGSDRILVSGEPGWLDYNAWDGDDVLFVTDSIADQQIHLGRGADTAVVCSTHEVSLTIDMGPHDADPDILVLKPAAFLGFPANHRRRFFVSGIVEGNDRIVLELPRGMHASIQQPTTANMLEATVGRTTITAMTTGDPFGRRGDPSIFVKAGEAPGPMPREQAIEHEVRGDSVAPRPAASATWSFEPSIGTEGRAGVTGEDGSRLEIVCGNSGGPSLSIVPDPRPDRSTGQEDRIAFALVVDGTPFEQDFLCAPDGNHCSALGVPPASVMSALRTGSRLAVRRGSADLAAYTLRGSNAAISRLAACLG